MLLNTKELKKALAMHKKLNSKTRLEVLKHSKIIIKNNRFIIITTDYGTTILSQLNTHTTSKDKFFINTKDFYKVVSAINTKEINIKIEDETMYINDIKLKIYKSDFIQPSYIDYDYLYENIPFYYNSIGTYSFENKPLKTVIDHHLNDDSIEYYNMYNIQLETIENKMAFLSTNNSTLSIYKLDGTAYKKVKRLVSYAAIKTLSNFNNGVISIFTSDKNTLFKINNTFILSEVIDDDFPNWKYVIPENQSIKVILNTKEIRNILKMIKKLDKTSNHKTTITITKNNFNIENIETGIIKNIKPVKVRMNDDSFDIDIDSNILLSTINSFKDTSNVVMTFNDTNTAIEVYEENKKDVLYNIFMPLRR